jgi:5'-methylthioadenosine phosphorylase
MPKNSSKFNKAIISGWNLNQMSFWPQTKKSAIKTPYGKVDYFSLGDCVFIPRHSIKESIPPHRINHRANISAIKQLGIRNIFAFNSVGSLKEEVRPGSFLLASDYVDFNPPTFFENQAKFIIPELSRELADAFKKILNDFKINFIPKGIYFQTKGPRFETKAEISFLKTIADVVGMTMAAEATLAAEAELEYASLCSVDNYANGVGERKLTLEEFKQGQKNMSSAIEQIIKKLIGAEIK